jgi:hypothetical protein
MKTTSWTDAAFGRWRECADQIWPSCRSAASLQGLAASGKSERFALMSAGLQRANSRRSVQNRVRGKTGFSLRFNPMTRVQPSAKKYFYFFFSEFVVSS